MKKYIKKILVIGNSGVGKTSLVTRYVENKFSDAYLSTIGVNIMKKMVSLEKEGEDIDVALMLWDVEGTASAKKIPAHYAKGTNGYIVVIDATREETLADLKTHLQYIDNAPFILAINKSDLPSIISFDKQVFQEEFSNCAAIVETSAKLNNNVEELFITITHSII